MAIIASCCFFIHMNDKEFKPKIHLIKILSVSFDLGLLKVDTYDIKNVKNEYLVMIWNFYSLYE